jgi:hypothetical protein
MVVLILFLLLLIKFIRPENEKVPETPLQAHAPKALDNFSIQQKMIRDYNSPSAASRCRAIRAMQ